MKKEITLPETRGGIKKYHFEMLEIGDYFPVKMTSKRVTESVRTCARQRGYKVAIRNINGEVRAYRVK